MGDENSLEICAPIKSLEGLLKWVPKVDWSIHAKPLKERAEYAYEGSTLCSSCPTERYHHLDIPKTLVCHDMRGGYTEDRFVKGCENHEAFRFYHWDNIDIFVYFSHNFVTIPPLAWINAGHLHGVPVLGTIIVEWNEGQKLLLQALADKVQRMIVCENLARICSHYKFDGYLINFECNIPSPFVPLLRELVECLRDSLKSAKSSNLLIWYDSITFPSGALSYQNQLNERNKVWFDICDGIFLNYIWKESGLEKSAEMSLERSTDVFVGIDVFGRGCYKGGGFNSHLAAEVARRYNLSVALFAPGWVHENQTPSDPFMNRDFLLWKNLTPFLYTRGVKSLPFTTYFCQGYGPKKYEGGKVTSDKPWHNMSLQEYQPVGLCGISDNSPEKYCLTHYTLDAFNGGSCILIKSNNLKHHVHRIFTCQFSILHNQTLEVAITTKELQNSERTNLYLVLSVMDSSGNRLRFIHLGSAENSDLPDGEIVDGVIHSIQNGWESRKYNLNNFEGIIYEIGCLLTGGDSILLGGVHIQANHKKANEI